MAAHIYAAAPGGPRGTGGLSAAERSEPENGIWCCYKHGKAIDADQGRSYSVAELKGWKRWHEARKGAELMGSAQHHVGFVGSISVNSAPATVLEGQKFDLGIRNVITGPNDSGKSILTRLIASVANPDSIAEMSRHRDVDMAVQWFDPFEHSAATAGRNGEVSHVVDGLDVASVARPYKTILLSTGCHDSIDTIVSLAQLFDLSETAMKSTLTLLAANNDLVKDVGYVGIRIRWSLDIDGRRTASAGEDLPYWVKSAILLEIADAHAQHHARVEPTILLLDEFIELYKHPRMATAALERLEKTAEHAQLVVVTHSPQVLSTATSLNWTSITLDSGAANKSANPIDYEVTT
ncbi:hypothetical protein [Nocardia africana]